MNSDYFSNLEKVTFELGGISEEKWKKSVLSRTVLLAINIDK